ncbi:MAG TPA: AI-2E family transporter [Xanthomonadaceae bacterium]|nr:AI-2E family transporter [Xanthomonadaceae bacterium]
MTATQRWQAFVLVLVLAGLVYLLAPVLTPFAIAALLAYLGDPLVEGMVKRGRNRTLAVSLVFLLMTLILVCVLLLLIPLVERQISRLVESLPRYIDYLRGQVQPWLEAQLGYSPDLFDPNQLVGMLKEHWRQAGGIAAGIVAGVSRSGLAILGWLVNLVLIPVVVFYLMRDWKPLLERARKLLPRPIEPTVMRLLGESDEVLGAFLRGQLLVMLVLGVLYSIGLWIIGVDFAILIGMLAGLLSFVPYLGLIVGMGVSLIAAYVQFQDWLPLLWVLLVFGVVQTFESVWLTPTLVGDRIGLHPVAVIFAVLAGGQLFGFLGVLLALPAAAVVMVVLRYLHERYRESELYGADAAVETVPAEVLEPPADGADASQADPA